MGRMDIEEIINIRLNICKFEPQIATFYVQKCFSVLLCK